MTLPFNLVVGKDGVIPIYGRELCARTIASFAGQHIHITIEAAKEYSSDKQRGYYFDVIVGSYLEHFAKKKKFFTKQQMHDILMRDVGGFGNPYVSPITGEPDSGRLSYNQLTKGQAEGYHTLCRAWAAKEQFDIPEPNEGIYAKRLRI